MAKAQFEKTHQSLPDLSKLSRQQKVKTSADQKHISAKPANLQLKTKPASGRLLDNQTSVQKTERPTNMEKVNPVLMPKPVAIPKFLYGDITIPNLSLRTQRPEQHEQDNEYINTTEDEAWMNVELPISKKSSFENKDIPTHLTQYPTATDLTDNHQQ